MFADKASKSRLLAFGIVAAFLLCSASCIAEADAIYGGGISDNTGNDTDQEYAVQMSVGQTFKYAGISTNLDSSDTGTVSYDWTGTAKDAGIAFTDDDSGRKLTGSFTAAGDYTGKLTATWTSSDEDMDGKIRTQTASQTFAFHVADKIVVTGDVTAYGMVGWDADDKVLDISYEGSGTVNATYTFGKDGHETNDTHFSVLHDATAKKIAIAPAAELTEKAGPEYVNVTLTNGESGDTAVMKVVLYVYDGIAITAPKTHVYTFEGDTESTVVVDGFVFGVTYDEDGDDTTVVSGKTMTFTPEGQTILTQDSSDWKKVGIDTSFETSGELTGNAESKDYTATLTVNGTAGSAAEGGASTVSTASAELVVTVYRALAFTSVPTISDVVAKSVGSGTGKSMILSVDMEGAKYVRFNWGDGSVSEKLAVPTGNKIDMAHDYAESKMYMITIEVENDVGTATSKVMYSAGEGAITIPDGSEEKKGFFDEHGFVFVIFLILAALMMFVAFYMGYQIPPVLISIPVFVVLAVLFYFYKDVGGIVDAIRGLF